MKQKELAVEPRQRLRKGDNKRLRRQGRIPSVIYGGDGAPASISVSEHELEMILRGGVHSSLVFGMKVDGASQHTILRAVERHPVSGRLLHLDFQRINLEEEVDFEVPLHVVGHEPQGVREGGVLEHVQRTVRVRCKPFNLPQVIECDLSNLKMHESFFVSDLVLPEGVTVLDAPGEALFSVVVPAAAVAAEESTADAAEPEVVSRKREDEE